MPKYQRKRLYQEDIEAHVWDGSPESTYQIINWAQQHGVGISQVTVVNQGDKLPVLYIHTQFGNVWEAKRGDFIVRNGVLFSPCAPETFVRIFEPFEPKTE